MADREAYLGDGLYASYDGYQIRLYAPRAFDVDEVFLEPAVYQSLLRFAKVIGITKEG